MPRYRSRENAIYHNARAVASRVRYAGEFRLVVMSDFSRSGGGDVETVRERDTREEQRRKICEQHSGAAAATRRRPVRFPPPPVTVPSAPPPVTYDRAEERVWSGFARARRVSDRGLLIVRGVVHFADFFSVALFFHRTVIRDENASAPSSTAATTTATAMTDRSL